MFKILTIMILIGSYTNQFGIAFGQNCSDKSVQRKPECVFECIKILYDKQYCWSCKKFSELHLNEPNYISSLLHHHPVFYNATKESLFYTDRCSDCKSDYDGDKPHTIYEHSNEFEQLRNCLPVNISHVEDKKCGDEEFQKIYAEIALRLNTSQWCLDSLDLNELFASYIKLEGINRNGANKSNNDEKFTAEPTETTITKSEESTTEDSTNSSQTHIEPESESKDDNPLIKESELSTTSLVPTTETPQESSTPTGTVSISETAPKSETPKRIPTPSEHHYHYSVAIIVVIAGIITGILVIVGVVCNIYVRRRRYESRTDSRTYVFDSR